MNILTLQRNVQFLYEERLARIEAQSLGCRRWERDGNDPWRVGVHADAGAAAAVIDRAAYAGGLDGRPTVYGELIRPAYRGGVFNGRRSVNQYLTHWIYPYRGKFPPQLARALLNIAGVRRGSLVLDPYVGSGTAALEASLLGADCVGVDLSPLCGLLTRAKTRSVEAVGEIRTRVRKLVELEPDPADASIRLNGSPAVADFVEAARMATLSDVSRRGRDGRARLRRNLRAMLASVEAHARALEVFGVEPGRVSGVVGDARDLRSAGVGDGTVDAVVTSPPYPLALDYVKNDAHALEALGASPAELRNAMTGVRGRGREEKLALYDEDMRGMFREVGRVLKPGAAAIFVIGDATVDRSGYAVVRRMAEWAGEVGLERERELRKVVFGLYNVMDDEKILIFRKPGRGAGVPGRCGCTASAGS